LIESNLKNYNLENSFLTVIQGGTNDNLNSELVQELRESLRQEIIKDMHNKSLEQENRLDNIIKSLEEKLRVSKKSLVSLNRIGAEAKINFKDIKSIMLTNSPILNIENNETDTIQTVIIQFNQNQSTEDLTKLKKWLKTRLQTDTLNLIIKNND